MTNQVFYPGFEGKSTVLGLWNTQPTCCSGLVVWNMNFICHVIYGIILPNLTFIFFRGVGIPPSSVCSQCCMPRIDGAPWQMGDGSRRQQCCRSVLFLLCLIQAVRKKHIQKSRYRYSSLYIYIYILYDTYMSYSLLSQVPPSVLRAVLVFSGSVDDPCSSQLLHVSCNVRPPSDVNVGL